MNLRLFKLIASNPKTIIGALLIAVFLGLHAWRNLAVDIFPDISIPRVTIMTEAGGLTAEEVEQLVTIPIESAVNGIPGVSKIRSSSSGGLSFVWVDFDWNVDIARARFDVFDRLSRAKETLPEEAHTEIAPVVSVTGEIMLVALTAKADPLKVREIAEYDLRTRLMAVPGIGEVAVIGGLLPEYRIGVDPRKTAAAGLTLFDVIEAARDSRTFLSGGYLADVAGEEVPLRQVARADNLNALRATPIPLATKGSIRLGDIATVSVAGEPRRGSASFNGQEAIVLSVQKSPGGNTPKLTKELEETLKDFASSVKGLGIEVHTDAYRQADFIAASVSGGTEVVKGAVIVVVIVLLVTLLEIRTLLVVLLTMPFSMLIALALFPALGLGINVMTLGGFAIAAGDIVDAAIIFTEVIRRKLGENAAKATSERKANALVIAEAASSVAPSILFSTLIVVIVFTPLLMLSGLEGSFFKPLALSYIAIFTMSLVAAWTAVPSLCAIFRISKPTFSLGLNIMRVIYKPFLAIAIRLPKTILLLAILASAAAIYVASNFGSSFLPPFKEDSFNVMLSLPPGASLAEMERVSEAAVPAIKEIPGVISVTRRTGRAERDQHAESVSTSEFIVRVDLKSDTDAIREEIRERLGDIPGASLVVGYPIAHRISAVLSGTEAEIAVNIFGDDVRVLRNTAAKIKEALENMNGIADVRANREITVKTLRINYDMDSLVEAGITPREAGEQVAAAFNGVIVGEVRDGIRRRNVTVRLEGDENAYDAQTVKSLILSSRNSKRVRLDEVAEVIPEEAPNLMLREGGRRKALISCNPDAGVDTGSLVSKMRERLLPIAEENACTVSFGGSYEARESAAKHLTVLCAALGVVIFFILVFALKSARAAILTLFNIPLALIGSVAAVSLTDSVLSVSSLVGFITVIGFTLRNGILLLNCYHERMEGGATLVDAVKEGSMERMTPIILTSLTTVIGLIPIMLAGNTPGGELLAPLAIVQFGGLIGSTILNLIVLPAAALTFKVGAEKPISAKVSSFAIIASFLSLTGCQSYEPMPIDWNEEMRNGVTNEIIISSPKDAETLALIANREINAMRLKAALSKEVAKEYGWWEDPSVDFDLLRIVNPSDHPLLGGVSLGFTIPLSGAIMLEEKSAEMYAEADREQIIAAEKDLAFQARKEAISLASLLETKAILERYDTDTRITKARENVEKLHTSGEVSASELAWMHRAVHSRRHSLMDIEREIDEKEIKLLQLLGIRPGAKISILFQPQSVKEREIKPVSAKSLIHHPAVKAATLKLGGSEAQLEAEIRKQYPNIKLGPAYSNEEGLDRFGIVAGITLPLWNRNRKEIAQAKAQRDQTRLEAIDVWRTLVCDAAVAHSSLVKLTGHPPVPSSERRQTDKLADAGELTPLDYLAVREEILDQKLGEAAWRRDVAIAAAELEKFKQ